MRLIVLAALAVFTSNATAVEALHVPSRAAQSLTKVSKPVQDPFRWHGRVARGKSIEITGLWGDVHARVAAGREVEVVAIKRAAESDPEEVTFQVVEHAGGVTICAVYPSDDPGEPSACRPGEGGAGSARGSDVRVDFEVRVPAGVRFVSRTLEGKVEVKLPTGDVAAHTIFGDIEIELPATASARIAAASTLGGIESDFPLQENSDGNATYASGTLRDGERKILLNTVTGTVRVRRAPGQD